MFGLPKRSSGLLKRSASLLDARFDLLKCPPAPIEPHLDTTEVGSRDRPAPDPQHEGTG